MTASQNSYQWLPSVYAMQGLPYALVTAVSPVVYKEFGFRNSEIAFFTSLFALPWALKFFFAPLLENLATKRKLTLWMQFLIAGLIPLLALTTIHSIYLSGIVFVLIAMASAMHDISADGLYLACLDVRAQAKCIGIRTLFYQVGKLFCQSGVIYLVGLFEITLTHEVAWSLVFYCLAIVVFVIAFYNCKSIPNNKNSAKNAFTFDINNILNSYKNVLNEFRQLPHALSTVIFFLFYNLPESQLIKILPLYMLDKVQQGGLNLTVSEVGIIYGGISVISMLIGVTLSGFFLNHFPLKKCLVPFTILTTLGNTSYLLLQVYFSHAFWQVSLCVFIAQAFFGLSNGAYMFYLITVFTKKRYAMSLYAIGTAMMLLGMMLGGSIAGYIQSLLGYTGFFTWIVIAGIGIIFLSFSNTEKIS